MSGPTANVYCLGVEAAFGRYFVSGGASASTGTKYVYWFDYAGALQGSVTQYNSMASNWGGRDGECDESTGKMWFGEENGTLSEYSWNGSALSYVTTYTIPGVGTVRALARNPTTNHFYTVSFSASIYESDLAGTVYMSRANPGSAFYGLGWDPCSNTLWGYSQNGAPLVRADEVNPASMTFTGKTFQGTNGPIANPIAGGCDVYVDSSANPGYLTMVGLHQSTPDALYAYDLAVVDCGGPPPFTLAKSGSCPGVMNFTATGATPGGNVAFTWGTGCGPAFAIPPGNPCAATILDIWPSLNPSPGFVVVAANVAGVASISRPVPPLFCGAAVVQAVDFGTCTTSNTVVTAPGGGCWWVLSSYQDLIVGAGSAGNITVTNLGPDVVNVRVNGVVKAVVAPLSSTTVGYQQGDNVDAWDANPGNYLWAGGVYSF